MKSGSGTSLINEYPYCEIGGYIIFYISFLLLNLGNYGMYHSLIRFFISGYTCIRGLRGVYQSFSLGFHYAVHGIDLTSGRCNIYSPHPLAIEAIAVGLLAHITWWGIYTYSSSAKLSMREYASEVLPFSIQFHILRVSLFWMYEIAMVVEEESNEVVDEVGWEVGTLVF